MNGDLSLSQSLGGLRIANADPVGDDLPSPSASQASPRYDADQLNVNALGFDPSNYASPQPPPISTSVSDSSARHYSHQKPPAANTNLRQQASYDQQQASRISRPAHERPYYPVAARPSSGLYDHYPPSARDATYESAMDPPYEAHSQFNNGGMTGGVRRSDSRAAAAAAMAARPSNRSYPAATSSSSVTSSNLPYRMARTESNQDTQYDSMRSTATTTPTSTSYGNEPTPLAASSEEWQDKGAAVSVQKTTDKHGKTSSRVVKKGVKDFQFGRTLGEGSYSTVLAATDRGSGREYAIKVLDKRHIIKEKKVKYVNIEKDTLNRLTDHPGIVRLYYTFQDERSLYFVLDLATGGELLGVLKKTGSFDEECSRFYSAQILDSIEYMHIRGIIHRDLKPENVLLDDQMHVKITDFGTAKILDLFGQQKFGSVSVSNDPMDGADTDRAVSFVGTAEYVSPELLTDKNACKASDLWAFGCIVYQLLAGRPPFKAGNEYQTFQKIVNLEYNFPEGFPPVARDLVKKLLVLDPAQRLPIQSIKAHPFFEGVEWGKGLWRQKAPKLRPYKPYQRTAAAAASAAARGHDPVGGKQLSKSGQSNDTSGPTTRPRMISTAAPPSQLDIDWAPVLTRPNERVLKLGNFVVYSMPAPFGAAAGENQAESTSKFSRFFGASATKKRSRLVMVSSAARLILAPSGGDKKEAKVIIDLNDKDVSYRSQQDAKGYTVWCVSTRDRNFTFEDSKTNTGDVGSSRRATQEWTDCIEAAREYAVSERSVTDDSRYNGLSSPTSGQPVESDNGFGSDRHMLRKDANADSDPMSRKRFSKRHSKNGLAAVF